MSAEKAVPWRDNELAQRVLERLQRGPASTIDLQRELPAVHVARQVWELRHWYGWRIRTGRLQNRVAVYTLQGRLDATVRECPSCHLPHRVGTTCRAAAA